jgi:glycosyltransferase involved in cell wall biosynthesis
MIPQRLAAASNNRLQKALLMLEAQNLARYEAESCRRFEHVVWVTEDDWVAVQKLGNETPVTNRNQVIPICIDLDEKPVLSSVSHPFRVTFIGGLHWPPNAEGVTWFYQEVWPQVSAVYPNAILTIVGKHPPKALASASVEDSTLEVTGYVADPANYLAETAVFIVPLHAGGGMRVKILDAWSWCLPVVSTTIGAEGLSYEAGEDVLLADSADEFAQAVLQVLSQPDIAARLREKGRRTVENYYNWRTVYPQWDQVYQS